MNQLMVGAILHPLELHSTSLKLSKICKWHESLKTRMHKTASNLYNLCKHYLCYMTGKYVLDDPDVNTSYQPKKIGEPKSLSILCLHTVLVLGPHCDHSLETPRILAKTTLDPGISTLCICRCKPRFVSSITSTKQPKYIYIYIYKYVRFNLSVNSAITDTNVGYIVDIVVFVACICIPIIGYEKKGLPVSDSWILSGVCFSKINTDVSKIVRNCFQIGTKSINIITQPYLSDLGNLFFLHFLHFSSISNLSTKKISGPWNFIQLLFSETSNLWNFNPRTGWRIITCKDLTFFKN